MIKLLVQACQGGAAHADPPGTYSRLAQDLPHMPIHRRPAGPAQTCGSTLVLCGALSHALVPEPEGQRPEASGGVHSSRSRPRQGWRATAVCPGTETPERSSGSLEA